MSLIDDWQQIYIDSSQRIDETSEDSDNFTINIGLKPGNNFDNVCVLQASIPKSWYNSYGDSDLPLGNGQTNYFEVLEQHNGHLTSHDLFIPQGNYTRQSLASTLSNLLTTNSINGFTYSVNYNNISQGVDSGKYIYNVITINNTDSIQFSFDELSYANILMGFEPDETDVFNNPNNDNNFQLISDNVTNCQVISSLQIHSNLIINPFSANSSYGDIMISITANQGTPSYGNISWVCPDVEAFSSPLSSNTGGNTSFRLTDSNGIPIHLNGLDWSMTLLLYKKNNGLKLLTPFIKLLTEHLLGFENPQMGFNQGVPREISNEP